MAAAAAAGRRAAAGVTIIMMITDGAAADGGVNMTLSVNYRAVPLRPGPPVPGEAHGSGGVTYSVSYR